MSCKTCGAQLDPKATEAELKQVRDELNIKKDTILASEHTKKLQNVVRLACKAAFQQDGYCGTECVILASRLENIEAYTVTQKDGFFHIALNDNQSVEDYIRVARLTRKLGGVYVSKGKDSHFEIKIEALSGIKKEAASHAAQA